MLISQAEGQNKPEHNKEENITAVNTGQRDKKNSMV
jgi:hypothetical protein